MFAYILRAPATPPTPQSDDFFRRFCETPGLLHAYSLDSVEGDDGLMVAVWENREAAERYLQTNPLRKEVDEAITGVTRTMYNVHDAK